MDKPKHDENREIKPYLTYSENPEKSLRSSKASLRASYAMKLSIRSSVILPGDLDEVDAQPGEMK